LPTLLISSRRDDPQEQNMKHPVRFATLLLAGSVLAMSAGAQGVIPSSVSPRPLDEVKLIQLDPIDLKMIALEDEMRLELGEAPRYAIPHSVLLTPMIHGTWDELGDGNMMWRLRIAAPEAVSLNLGFGEYFLPAHAELRIFDGYDESNGVRPFTAADNEIHGELWTPIVSTSEIVVQLTIHQKHLGDLKLKLTQIGYGYRGFSAPKNGSGRSGSCNVDVVCPEGANWSNEIPSVGVISTGGSTFCTGFLVNNTANDGTPYFMTAYHCGISSSAAPSLVVYWNYENSTCRPVGSSGGAGDGSHADFNTGSYFRAEYSTSDVTLVELDDDPSPFDVTYSGWDRTGVDATSAVAIHHPDVEEKRISFEYQSTATSSYLGTSVPGDGTHVWVDDWDLGTTEPGSSGSPLFDQNHRVIGQLHGGYAACGNDDSDWYGKFSVSWTGGGTASTRLSDWLDPTGSGATTVDTLGAGMTVTPGGTVTHMGPIGGPFSNPTTTYTMSNNTGAPINYAVALANDIGILLNGGTTPVTGTLLDGGTAQVVITLGSALNVLPPGTYQELVQFTDVGASQTITRAHNVEVGRVIAYSETFDTDPGWTTQGQWAFGHPTGGGGQYGNPDPIGGHTGTNCYGYNLAGDYGNDIPEYHLISTAFDCSGITGTELRFWRYLNVESPSYDHAKVSISTNGTSWTTLWENGSETVDGSWSQQSYDISTIADNQSTVYLRWTMGVTDGSWQYSGWNIDDLEFLGFQSGAASATFRNAGTNPASYTASNLPVLGTSYVALIDLTTTGHTTAVLVGYGAPLSLTLPWGQTALVNFSGNEYFGAPSSIGPIASISVSIPSSVAYVGFSVFTQAAHIGGISPYALSNAQDLVLGY
jgi:hypothetical protein